MRKMDYDDAGQGGWFGESHKHSLAARRGSERRRVSYVKKRLSDGGVITLRKRRTPYFNIEETI